MGESFQILARLLRLDNLDFIQSSDMNLCAN